MVLFSNVKERYSSIPVPYNLVPVHYPANPVVRNRLDTEFRLCLEIIRVQVKDIFPIHTRNISRSSPVNITDLGIPERVPGIVEIFE